MKNKAFTLIELLVVISVIALLLSILMPSLNRVKEIARAVVCSSNQAQLGKAWYLYQTENNDSVIDGAPRVSGTVTYEDQTNPTFVAEPQNESGQFLNTCIEDKIRGFKRGGLWDYYENYKLMNCRSGKRYMHPPTIVTPSATNSIGGYRSYSIGAVYSLAGYGATTTKESEHVTLKYTQIREPSRKIVWIEEADGCGYNQNTYNMWLDQPLLWDPVAVWHYENSTFAFADGHADMYKWSDENLIEMGIKGEKMITLTNMEDYEWFRDSYIPR